MPVSSHVLEGTNYRPVNEERTLTASMSQTCINVEILDDGVENGNNVKSFSIQIDEVFSTGDVTVNAALLNIQIQDSDRKFESLLFLALTASLLYFYQFLR